MTQVPEPYGSRALLVGVPLVAGFDRLDYVDRNLDDLKSALSHERYGILPADRITVLRSPSRAEWLEELRRAGELTTDLLLCYFVGHGYRDPRHQILYLLTAETEIQGDFKGTAVSWPDVVETLEHLRFRRAVFILDCCHSGTAAYGPGVGKSGHYILGSSLPTKLQPTDGVPGEERHCDRGEGKDCGDGDGDGCGCGCGAGEKPGAGLRSRFTHGVLTAMAEGGEPGSPGLTMQNLYDWLYEETPGWPAGEGDGWGPKGGSGGDGPGVVISRAVRAHESLPPAPPPSLPAQHPPAQHPPVSGVAGAGEIPETPSVPATPDDGGPGVGSRQPPAAPLLGRLLNRLRGPGRSPLRGSGGPRPEDRRRAFTAALLGRWKTLVALAAVLSLAAGAVVYGAHLLAEPEQPPCPPPLELRLMTGVEARAAVARAATAYMDDGANHRPLGKEDDAPSHCRRANFTVYEAGTRETAEAFGAADSWAGYRPGRGSTPTDAGSGAPSPGTACGAATKGAENGSGEQDDGKTGETEGEDTAAGSGVPALCADPLQDIGPQPDLLVAGSSTELGRIEGRLRRAPGPAAVRDLGPVGYSPLVLAVPAALEERLADEGVRRTGSTWEELLEAMEQVAPDMPLLRPDPNTSGTGLQHTVGLYESRDGRFTGGAERDAEGVEQRLRRDSAPARDAAGLLCALVKGGGAGEPRLGRAAALVAEKHVADFNLGARPGSACDNSRPADDASRLLAYYPKGVPALDLRVAEVRWEGTGDAARRTAAVRQFHDWLAGEGGDRLLDGLVRGVDAKGRPVPPTGEAEAWADPATSGVLADVPVVTGEPVDLVADGVVEEYTRTRDPGQVLFLMDVSGSMAEGGKLALADAALRRSLQRLGPQDTYGVWSYPRSAKEPAKARTVVGRGTPGDDRQAALSWADSLSPERAVPRGAAVYEVLERALRETRGDDRPLIVLITDGDDRPENDPDGPAFTAMRQERDRNGSAEVLVLSTKLEGCTAQIQGFENPSGTGCFAGRPEEAAEALAERVASEVRGGLGDEAR